MRVYKHFLSDSRRAKKNRVLNRSIIHPFSCHHFGTFNCYSSIVKEKNTDRYICSLSGLRAQMESKVNSLPVLPAWGGAGSDKQMKTRPGAGRDGECKRPPTVGGLRMVDCYLFITQALNYGLGHRLLAPSNFIITITKKYRNEIIRDTY